MSLQLTARKKQWFKLNLTKIKPNIITKIIFEQGTKCYSCFTDENNNTGISSKNMEIYHTNYPNITIRRFIFNFTLSKDFKMRRKYVKLVCPCTPKERITLDELKNTKFEQKEYKYILYIILN